MKKFQQFTGKHPDDPRPWAVFTVEDGVLEATIHELNGADVHVSEHHPDYVTEQVKKHGLKGDRKAQKKAVKDSVKAQMQAAHKTHKNLKHDPKKPTEQHMLVVTLEGDVVFWPISQPIAFVYAHLAYHDPVTGEWSKYEFVDDGVVAEPVPVPENGGWVSV